MIYDFIFVLQIFILFLVLFVYRLIKKQREEIDSVKLLCSRVLNGRLSEVEENIKELKKIVYWLERLVSPTPDPRQSDPENILCDPEIMKAYIEKFKDVGFDIESGRMVRIFEKEEK